jgi:glutaredoxin-related protein
VFIAGQFYGDTDILEPMAKSGELAKLLEKSFEGKGVTPSIQLR